MTIQRPIPDCLVILGVALIFLVTAPPAPAQVVDVVSPGETIFFVSSEGGMTECREKDLPEPCLTPPLSNWGVDTTGILPGGSWPYQGTFHGEPEWHWLKTKAVPDRNVVSTAYSVTAFNNPLDQVKIGIPQVSTAALYKDFKIADPDYTEHVVDARITVDYAWEGMFAGSGNYDIDWTLDLEVEDITAGPGQTEAVGSLALVSKNRQGDQSISLSVPPGLDISLADSGWDYNSESANFPVKLVRGKVYRIWFKAQTATAPNTSKMTGFFNTGLRARWWNMSVTVDEDLTELVTVHDTDIKSILSDIQIELEEIRDILEQCCADDPPDDPDDGDDECVDDPDEDDDTPTSWRDRLHRWKKN
jgi:hypothetical protein